MFNVINNLYNNQYSLSDLFRSNSVKKKLYTEKHCNEQNKITQNGVFETNTNNLNNTGQLIPEELAMGVFRKLQPRQNRSVLLYPVSPLPGQALQGSAEVEPGGCIRLRKNLIDLTIIDKSLKKKSIPFGITNSHVLRTGKAYPESIKVGKYNLRKEPSKILQFDKEFQKLYTSSRKKNKRKIYKICKKILKINCKKTNCKKTNCKKTNCKKTNCKKNNCKKTNCKKANYKKKNIKIEQRKHISLIDRKKILFDQKYICNFCDRILDPNHEFDHIIPLYCGGKNKYSNYQALCKECHQYKSDFLDNKIINPMTTNNQNCDPQKVIVILKKIYQNHYS